MNNIKIKKLIQEIEEKRIRDNDEINNYLKNSKIINTNSDKIIFLKEYAKVDPFPRLYIGQEFLKCATLTKKYVNFITWLAKKDFDILDGSVLVGAYEKNPKLVEYIWKELSKNTETNVAYVLGSLLGGMGIKEPQKLFEILSKDYELTKIEPVIIMSIQETSYTHKIPQKFIDLLLKYANFEDRWIKFNAIRVLANRFNKNEKVHRKLIQLAKTDNDTKSMICKISCMISKDNKILCLKLLQECAKTNDENLILNGVSRGVGCISKDYPIECLAILKKWIKKIDSMTIPGQNMMWSAGQMGETECFEEIEKFLLEWINIESKRQKKDTYRILEFSLPPLIYEIYKKDESHLLLLLEKIDHTQKRKSSFIVKTMKIIFSKEYDLKHPSFNDSCKKLLEKSPSFNDSCKKLLEKSPSFNDSCKKLLEKIAMHQNIDTSIDKDIEDPIIQTLALIENIVSHKEQIDTVQTKKNLKQFKNIINFFDEKKLHELIDVEKNHPLVLLLSKSKITKQFMRKIVKKRDETDDEFYKRRLNCESPMKFSPQAILTDLNKSLENLDVKGTKELRGQMLHEGFYPGLIQLNIYARFKKKYCVELEPKVSSKTLDVKLIIDGKNYFFEIYTPKNPQKLDYVRIAHKIDGDKAYKKIIDKFLKQLKACRNLNSPVILIIDNQNMSMDKYDITNFLKGSLQFRIPIDVSNKTLKPYAIRANDSFNERFNDGNLLNAIILLRREVGYADLKVKLCGQTYENPGAKFPIDKKIFKKIEDNLLNTTIG